MPHPMEPRISEGNVLSHLYDVPFIGQRKIGKGGLPKKRAMDDFVALSQGRRTVRTGSAEIEGKEIRAIGIITGQIIRQDL